MSIDRFSLSIPGEPVAKGRPRVLRNGMTYTPKKTKDWERAARILAGQAMFLQERELFAGPVRLRVMAVFEITPSWPAWKQEAAAKGIVRHTSKPDYDNLVKAAKDALNGVVYADDAQVVEHSGGKAYGEAPHVYITVEPIDGLPCQIRKRAELDEYLYVQQQQR